MNLYEATSEAQIACDVYRSPDIGEWITNIDKVLAALGGPQIGDDAVDSIAIGDEYVSIQTSYTVRNCHQTNQMYIPVSVIKSDDPVKAATLYHLTERLARENQKLEYARTQAKQCNENIKSIERQLAALN